jgi:hypothetical protein
MDEANGYFDYSGGVDLNLSYRGILRVSET